MKVVFLLGLIIAAAVGGVYVSLPEDTTASLTSTDELPPCITDTATDCRITQETIRTQEYVEKPTEKKEESLPDCPSPTATNCRPTNTNQIKQEACTGEGTVKLASPMKIEDIGIVIPMGMMAGGHVTPIDHMYFSPINFQSAPDTYDVYADADGVITDIGLEGFVEATNSYKKYRIVIYHTCDFYSIYNLLTSTSDKITAVTGELSPGQGKSVSIPIKKGELLGKIGGQTLDLSVNYDKVVLSGFIVPEHYEHESWKIHTVDPFDYFEESARAQLMAKNVRTVEPWGGKIDYDVDGKLVGNWFVEDTNGYRGITNGPGYWSTHLAFAYDHIDPRLVIVSLGNYSGEAVQLAVKGGNNPDPKDVTSSSGLIKYELVDFTYQTANGQYWDRTSYAKGLQAKGMNDVKGVVLVQMLEERKIKVETFPGKTASQVSGFTSSAKIYER